MKVISIINDKRYNFPYSNAQGIIQRFSTILKRESDHFSGYVKVDYGHGEYNHFTFDGMRDLKQKLLPCFEPGLLEFIHETNR